MHFQTWSRLDYQLLFQQTQHRSQLWSIWSPVEKDLATTILAKVANWQDRTNLINSYDKRLHHPSFSFPLSSYRNSTWMHKLVVAKWSVENVPFSKSAPHVICREVSSPSGFFLATEFFLWRPFYNWRPPKGDFLSAAQESSWNQIYLWILISTLVYLWHVENLILGRS